MSQNADSIMNYKCDGENYNTKESYVAVINKTSKYMNQEDEDYNPKENCVKDKGALMDNNDYYHDDEFPFIEVDIIPEVKKITTRLRILHNNSERRKSVHKR